MTVTTTQPLAPPMDGPDHVPASIRFRAHLHRHRLDLELAEGTDPGDPALLRQRERELLSRRCRVRLACALDRLLEEAEGPMPLFGSKAPLARAALCECRAEVDALVTRLDSDLAVAPRGVAQIALLVRDGHSPLYSTATPAEALRGVLATASAALDRD